MSQKIKNQHYVPIMYMKRFITDEKGLCVWNLKKDKIIVNQRPDNYAAQRFFYDTDKTQLKHVCQEMMERYPRVRTIVDAADEQFVEKGLARMETDVAPILDLIHNDHEALYNKVNMQKLIIFIHALAYRSEKIRDSLDYVKILTQKHLEKLGITPNKIKGINNVTAKEEQLYQLVGIAPLQETAKMLVGNYNWYIGIVTGTMKLVISDNPAQGVMLGFNDICIPISGDKAVILRTKFSKAPIISKDMPTNNEILLTERSVFAYNVLQLGYVKRFMFGDEYSLDLLKKRVR